MAGLTGGNTQMRISDKGIELIKHFEGCSLTGYLDPVGVPTIGYGHTITAQVGAVIDQEWAEKLLRGDLRRFELGIDTMVAVPLTQGQYDALVSFAFNLGLGNLSRSTLLKILNMGNYEAAAKEFPRWNKAGGKVLRGLTRRREAEKQLFLTGEVDLD